MSVVLYEVQRELDENEGSLSHGFIALQADRSDVSYFKLSDNMRVCLIRTPHGAEVLGVSQVLNAENDVEVIGNEVAYNDAFNQLWKVYGAMALAVHNG